MSDFAGFARGPADARDPDTFDWGVRTHVYAAFRRSGKAPTIQDLTAVTGAPAGRILAALRALDDAHELVLDGKREAVRMAHPFSGVATDFPVETDDVNCYANCAWDALGVLALLGSDGRVQTTCPASGEPVEFGVQRRRVVGDEDIVAHLLTPIRDAWEDIGFT